MRNRWLRCTTAWICPAITDRIWKALVFVLLGAPLALLGVDVVGEIVAPGSRLGADPGTEIVHTLGAWSMRMLLLTLLVSSARRLGRWPRLLRHRRMVGLYAFSYVLLHFLAYLGFLAGFAWAAIGEDLTERPYISVGFLALLGLIPLAITSTSGWRRRLGRRWQKLHRLIYPVTGLGLVHYFWLTRDGYAEGVLYLGIFAALMIERLLRRRRSGSAAGAAGAGLGQ